MTIEGVEFFLKHTAVRPSCVNAVLESKIQSIFIITIATTMIVALMIILVLDWQSPLRFIIIIIMIVIIIMTDVQYLRWYPVNAHIVLDQKSPLGLWFVSLLCRTFRWRAVSDLAKRVVFWHRSSANSFSIK